MRGPLAAGVGALLTATITTGSPVTAATAQQQTVTLDVASIFPGTLPLIGEGALHLIAKIARASDGRLVLAFHAPGALVPAADTVNAVADGRVDAAWAGAGWFASRDSAFNMFSTVPFGPGIGEYMAWMYDGGGLELARGMFHQYGIHNVPCAVLPPEASGWFHKEVRTPEDLRGLRMRFFGLGSKVMAKLGVVTQQLPPSEIRPAMERGEIDAAEFSLPVMDRLLGLQQVAHYYYFPGWHQQATFFDLYINLARWNGLSHQDQAIIELACGDTVRETIARGEAAQWQALKQMQSEGIQLRRWSPEILVAFENAWSEVVEEESAANPNFRRIYDSYATFRANYRIWHYLSYLQ